MDQRLNITRCPSTREIRVVDQADTIDLEELQGVLVHIDAVIIGAPGKVVDDGALVRGYPVSPVQLDLVPSIGRGVSPGGLGVRMADYITRVVVGGGDEALVRVGRCPAYDRGGVRLVWIRKRVETVVICAGDVDTLDVTMSSYRHAAEEYSTQGLHVGSDG